MEDNWYSAAVDASNPSNIISVHDWASDSSVLPIPLPEEKPGATYQVFKWGVNDPSESDRTFEPENFDPLASPLGWHSLSFSKLPPGLTIHGSRSDSDIFNSTTTLGNNVSISLSLVITGRVRFLIGHMIYVGFRTRKLGRSQCLVKQLSSRGAPWFQIPL